MFYYSHLEKLKNVKFNLKLSEHLVEEKNIIPLTFIIYELFEKIYKSFSEREDKCIDIYSKENEISIAVQGIDKEKMENIPKTSEELIEIFIKQINADFKVIFDNKKIIFKIILGRRYEHKTR